MLVKKLEYTPPPPELFHEIVPLFPSHNGCVTVSLITTLHAGSFNKAD